MYASCLAKMYSCSRCHLGTKRQDEVSTCIFETSQRHPSDTNHHSLLLLKSILSQPLVLQIRKMLSLHLPYPKPRNNLAYIPSLDAPLPAPTDLLSNQHSNAIQVKEEAIDLALYEISSEPYSPAQEQQHHQSTAPATEFATIDAADSTPPIVKQEIDLEELDTHQRWIDGKKWLSDLWKTLPAVPSIRSRCAWANARGFEPPTVHKWFSSKKCAYKKKTRGVIHPQDGYELSIEEPRESLLVSLVPPGLQSSSIDRTPALGAFSSPLPQTPSDSEPLDTLEASVSSLESKTTKRKSQASIRPPLLSLAPGICSGQILISSQASTGACMRAYNLYFA